MFVLLPVSLLECTFPGSRVPEIFGAVSSTLCAGSCPRRWDQVSCPRCPGSPAERDSGNEPAGPGQPSAQRGPSKGPGLACGAMVQQPSVYCWTRDSEWRGWPLGKGACRAPQPQGKPQGVLGPKDPPQGPGPRLLPPGPGATPSCVASTPAGSGNSESWEAPSSPSQGSFRLRVCLGGGGLRTRFCPQRDPFW